MVGWMDDEALHRTLTTGRATYWSRSRGEYWRKGDTSGHVQHVREVRLDCDGDALLVVVDQVGAACHTGARTCFDADRAARPLSVPPAGPSAPSTMARMPSDQAPDHAPDLAAFRALARDRRVIPVTRRLLADGETPLSVYRKLAGGRPGTFLLESAEHRRCLVALLLRRRALARHADRARRAGALAGRAAGRRADRRRPARRAARRPSQALHTERLPGLPPLTGGLVGIRLRRRAPARAAARPARPTTCTCPSSR